MSGGPDSLALLVLAAEAFPGRVRAATVDHGLRPESADEARFCADVCSRLDVPHRILTVEVARGNLQSEARSARYAALAVWAEDQAIEALLTGHHADDQAETLLMRLNRGSGVAGLAGVRATATVPGAELPLLRPLLGWRKSELEAVCATKGVNPVRDPSNLDERFDRVRVRKALADADWLDVAALAASAANLADAAEVLEWAAGREVAERVERDGDMTTYRSPAPFAVQLRVLSSLVALHGNEPREGALARLMRSLEAGQRGTIAGALIERTGEGWRVLKEPPRT